MTLLFLYVQVRILFVSLVVLIRIITVELTLTSQIIKAFKPLDERRLELK